MSLTPAGEQDRQWMRRALDLAAQSAALSSPNPAVGCVLTKDGRLAGEGFHEYDKRDHAEIAALRQAGDRARGASAYVTLEPCNHQGRTGPCTEALLTAGVRRVVIATRDPNPMVHGSGIERLIAAGVQVETGLLETEARKLNDAFARYTRTSLPFVTMKVASSLDGRIAGGRDAAKSRLWITGEAAREEVHKMRHTADALLTGVGTILADDPLLTDRSNQPRRRPLLRVVLDSMLRTPIDSKLVTTANHDVLIFFTKASSAAQQSLKERGVRLECLEGTGERVCLTGAIKRLGSMEITSVLIEGGATINTAALEEQAVDRFALFYAPIFLGSDALPMVYSTARPLVVKTPAEFTLRKFGDDFAFEGYLRDPWAGVK